jgi:hypothetical protein
MPRIAARREFDEKVKSGRRPTPDDVLRMVRLDTDDEAQAQDAASEWASACARADELGGKA